MTTDRALITFTTARLNEDEAIANAAAICNAMDWRQGAGSVGRCTVLAAGRTVVSDHAPAPEEAAHIARHDPKRALREVEAKRRIVDDYRITASAIDMITGPDIDTAGYQAMCAGRDALRASVLALAAIWADHPDYQQACQP